MEASSQAEKKKNLMLIIAVVFMIINTIGILLMFNKEFFWTTDKAIWSSNFNLIGTGVSLAAFFICLKYLKNYTLTKLLLIFIVIRITLFFYFTILDYSPEIDFQTFKIISQNVLDGGLFTPYNPDWLSDWWRFYPPMHMWWYTYNFFVYMLNVDIWRFVNVLLEIGIVIVTIKIFQENKTTEEGWSTENFKTGLIFYIVSIISIYTVTLQAHLTAFPLLLAMIGFLYFFRSKTQPNNIYYAVFFFSICALGLYFGAIWVLGILLIFLFRMKLKKLFILIIEVVAIFCLVCLPMLINDAFGFIERLFWQYAYFEIHWNGSIWTTDFTFLNFVSIILAIALVTFYTYKTYSSETKLDYFIVILSIFFFFSPHFAPWYYLWILPIVSITLIYSFRKFLIANLFFLGYFFVFIILFAIAFAVYPAPIPTIWESAYGTIVVFMEDNGFFLILQAVGHVFYQLGFIYLIYSYYKSKRFLLCLIIPFLIFYSLNLIHMI